jgi:hypothetical protein
MRAISATLFCLVGYPYRNEGGYTGVKVVG